jgi:U32 family peptidase
VTPELLAPGGSFLAAYHAFEAGADGVYLGLKEFSARKAAANFSLEQLRRIRQLAADRGRRIYVTINTVIREEERPRLVDALRHLEALAVDGILVQDLGVVELVRRRFPGLILHASTQMALHNDAGLALAQELGITRVVLPRELPLPVIRRLREGHPRLELEVFIHGALCYSFSGVCLASSVLTGRSSNRGDCAQICRSDFGGDAHGHLFSCRDLFTGRDVLKLAEAGVHSLKIEGRMKSPEYVANVTALYRAILDQGPGLAEEEYAELARRASLGFSRRPTSGWLRSSKGTDLVERDWPGHRGTALGMLSEVRGRALTLTIGADVSVRDGIGWFLSPDAAPVAVPVIGIRRGEREARFARAGETVALEVPADVELPRPGAEIRHLSSRFLDLPEPKEASVAMYRAPLALSARLDREGRLTVRGDGPCAAAPPFQARVGVEEARAPRAFAPILQALFAESGESLFTAASLSLENATGLPDTAIFVPPSQLKKVKNEFYQELDAWFATPAGPGSEAPARVTAGVSAEASARETPERQELSPPGGAPVPFVDADPARVSLSGLSRADGRAWLPLPPVIMGATGWPDAIARVAAEARAAGTALCVGMNNLSHVAIARASAGPGVTFFADVFLYVANAGTVRLLLSLVPDLRFVYAWVEGDAADARALTDAAPGVPVVTAGPLFRPPLFVSMGCFARHDLFGGACPADCPKDFTRALTQGSGRFTVVVRDCVTWLFSA